MLIHALALAFILHILFRLTLLRGFPFLVGDGFWLILAGAGAGGAAAYYDYDWRWALAVAFLAEALFMIRTFLDVVSDLCKVSVLRRTNR